MARTCSGWPADESGRHDERASPPEAMNVFWTAQVAGPLTVTHRGQLPVVTISFNSRPAWRPVQQSIKSRRWKADRAASHDQTGCFGHGAGVPAVMAGSGLRRHVSDPDVRAVPTLSWWGVFSLAPSHPPSSRAVGAACLA
jgi:hypothetical protein